MPSTDSDDRVPRTALGHTRRLAVAAVRWAAIGAVLGVAVSLGLLLIWTPRAATDTAFALGALVLGFGVTAWSAAVGLGRTIEGMRDRLDVSSGWTEASAREAFFVLSWTGAGWVIAATVSSIVLGV